jgi:hypothetical protein|tara:strand:- start:162 stop:407 length:246 start_codon:yes stop_codon:yes gene_type:complete
MAIKEDAKIIGHREINGKQIPIIRCATETIIYHTGTGKEYDSEEAAQADVDDPATSTTVSHIKRNVKISVANLHMEGVTKI